MTEQKRRDYKHRVRRQLDCSPRPSFEDQMYREYITLILSHHPKYVRISCRNDDLNVKSILSPYYSRSVYSKEIQQRILRWFRWYKRVTENRELIEHDNGWCVIYR